MNVQQQPSQYFSNVRTEVEPLLPPRMKTVLELGCGAGGTMRWLRQQHEIEYAAGMELFPDAAEEARSCFDEVHVGDVEKLPLSFRCEKFDAVLALDVLEHLADPWALLRRLRGHVAEDGVIIASIPNVSHFKVAFPLFFKGSWEYADSGHLDRTHLRFFNERGVRSLFEATGFHVRKLDCTTAYPDVLSFLGMSERRSRWYSQRLLRAVPVLPKRFIASQYLVAATPA
jgi:SAM-dependent methyltransferase